MAVTWAMNGQWLKNCNCDPGCPCDFNQHPTHDHCEAAFGMRIESGHVGDTRLDGLHWIGLVWWPGRMDEGNGDLQFIVDERADEDQRRALQRILSGEAGGVFFQIVDMICPNKKETIYAPFEWEWNREERSARVRTGDVFETETETLRGIDPPDPYRVLINIPGGFEYTGPDNSADIALATRIRSSADIRLDLTNGHSSITQVEHGGELAA